MDDVIIIGCGVVGAACAYALSRHELNVTILAAGSDIAAGTKAAITPMDWAAMVLLCFVLPAVLSVVFCEVERKLGWIKEGDLKLN